MYVCLSHVSFPAGPVLRISNVISWCIWWSVELGIVYTWYTFKYMYMYTQAHEPHEPQDPVCDMLQHMLYWHSCCACSCIIKNLKRERPFRSLKQRPTIAMHSAYKQALERRTPGKLQSTTISKRVLLLLLLRLLLLHEWWGLVDIWLRFGVSNLYNYF